LFVNRKFIKTEQTHRNFPGFPETSAFGDAALNSWGKKERQATFSLLSGYWDRNSLLKEYARTVKFGIADGVMRALLFWGLSKYNDPRNGKNGIPAPPKFPESR
jgi:hypothetical protein